jgi:prolyl-tRNA synthetase
LRVEVDDRDIRGGEKSWEWIKKGVPLRLEIGIRDIENGSLCVRRRDKSPKDKEFIGHGEFVDSVGEIFKNFHRNLFQRAENFLNEKSKHIESKEELFDFFSQKNSGFAYTHCCGDCAIEEQMKANFGVTIRCFPFAETSPGKCIFSGKPSPQKVVWARSY